MSERYTGGPAFPVDYYMREGLRQTEGMSLRDYFAGQAIVGMLAHGAGPASLWIDHPPSAADWAYSIADAMIAHRVLSPERKDQSNG